MSDSKDYVVNCKGSMVHPNLFRTFLTGGGMGLSKKAMAEAETLLLLSAALPHIPAGVLLSLVQGKLKWEVDDEAETFIIKGAS